MLCTASLSNVASWLKTQENVELWPFLIAMSYHRTVVNKYIIWIEKKTRNMYNIHSCEIMMTE